MKRFLVSFIIGMTLLAAGVTTLIFELRDFRFIDATSEEVEKNLLRDEVTITNENVNLYFDDHLSYDIRIDNTVKEGVLQLDYADTIVFRNERTSLYFSYADPAHITSFHEGWEAFQMVLDGLKKHEIYSFEARYAIRITCNETTRKHLRFYQD